MSTAQVRVAGQPLDLIGPVADLWDSTTWRRGDYSGDYQCEFTWHPPRGYEAMPWLIRGAFIDVTGMGGREWYGTITDFTPDDDNGWQVSAAGLGSLAAKYAALDQNASDAVNAAIGRGLPWVNSGITATLTNGGANPYLTVADVLNADSQASGATGAHWVVDSNGILNYKQDPTTPQYVLPPGFGVLPRADDNYVSHLAGRYATAVTNGQPSAWALTAFVPVPGANAGRVEAVIDLTAQGALTVGSATNYIKARAALIPARMDYTDGFTISPGFLFKAGSGTGHPMDLRAGQMLRAPDVFNDPQFVLGEVKRFHADNHVEVTPVGFADRDFEGALAAAPAPDAAA